eukprot:SAG11_NODE_8025_length_1068_cov_1.395253_2_plen_176_part_00
MLPGFAALLWIGGRYVDDFVCGPTIDLELQGVVEAAVEQSWSWFGVFKGIFGCVVLIGMFRACNTCGKFICGLCVAILVGIWICGITLSASSIANGNAENLPSPVPAGFFEEYGIQRVRVDYSKLANEIWTVADPVPTTNVTAEYFLEVDVDEPLTASTTEITEMVGSYCSYPPM